MAHQGNIVNHSELRKAVTGLDDGAFAVTQMLQAVVTMTLTAGKMSVVGNGLDFEMLHCLMLLASAAMKLRGRVLVAALLFLGDLDHLVLQILRAYFETD